MTPLDPKSQEDSVISSHDVAISPPFLASHSDPSATARDAGAGLLSTFAALLPIAASLLLTPIARADTDEATLGRRHLVVVHEPGKEPWGEERIRAFLVEGGIGLHAMRQGRHASSDPWTFEFDIDLPYGRKDVEMTIDIEEVRRARPENGSPPAVSTCCGTPVAFDPMERTLLGMTATGRSDDVTRAVSSRYQITLPKAPMRLSSVALLTTGTSDVIAAVRSLRVDVWPEAGDAFSVSPPSSRGRTDED